jgi:hypothetical protein
MYELIQRTNSRVADLRSEANVAGYLERDETLEALEVDSNELINSRLAHLEHYFAAIQESRGVDLGDGRTSQGLRVEKWQALMSLVKTRVPM